jgi:hypothetical protein
MQRIVHGALLPILDKKREGYSDKAYPQQIKEANQKTHRDFMTAPSAIPRKDQVPTADRQVS